MSFILFVIACLLSFSAVVPLNAVRSGTSVYEVVSTVQFFAHHNTIFFVIFVAAIFLLSWAFLPRHKKPAPAKQEAAAAPVVVTVRLDEGSINAALAIMENSLTGYAQFISKLKQVDLDEELKARIAEVGRRVMNIRERLNAYVDDPDNGKVIASLSGVKEQVDAIETALSDFENSDVAQETSDLEDAVKDFTKRIADLDPATKKLPKLKEQIDALELRLAPLRDDETGSTALFNELDGRVRDLSEELDTLESGINESAFEDDVAALESNIDEIKERAERALSLFVRLKAAGKDLSEAVAVAA